MVAVSRGSRPQRVQPSVERSAASRLTANYTRTPGSSSMTDTTQQAGAPLLGRPAGGLQHHLDGSVGPDYTATP